MTLIRRRRDPKWPGGAVAKTKLPLCRMKSWAGPEEPSVWKPAGTRCVKLQWTNTKTGLKSSQQIEKTESVQIRQWWLTANMWWESKWKQKRKCTNGFGRLQTDRQTTAWTVKDQVGNSPPACWSRVRQVVGHSEFNLCSVGSCDVVRLNPRPHHSCAYLYRLRLLVYF